MVGYFRKKGSVECNVKDAMCSYIFIIIFVNFGELSGYYGTRKDYEKKITMKRTHTMADMMSKLLENPWENVNISGRRENRNLLQTINISAAT